MSPNRGAAVKAEWMDGASKPDNVIVLDRGVFEAGYAQAAKPVADADADAENAAAEVRRDDDGGSAIPDNAPLPKKPLSYRFAKRAFDIVFSAVVIVGGFIPGLILSAFIVKDTGGSPIYSSVRIGRNGKPFRIYKFRSMVADSDDLEKYFTPDQLAQWHREHKVDDDPRITKLGNFIRETSIDEFPQFINVFLGQISVVGPRVITEEEVGYFGADREKLLSVPPGITGVWQTGPRNLATFESGLRQEMELLYVDNASARFDLALVAKTVRSMIERTGK